MGLVDKIVQVVFKGTDDVTPAAKTAQKSTEGFASGVGNVLKGLAGLIAGLALGQFFKKAVEEAQTSREAMAALELTVTNSGASFEKMSPQIEGTISKLASLTKFGDDDFTKAMQQMTLKTGDADWALENLGQAADLAAAAGIPLEQAAAALAQAHEGNTKALNKMVPELKGATNWQELLAEKTQGAAEAQMRALGPTAAISKQFGEFAESVGKAILGNESFEEGGFDLATMLGELATWIDTNAEALDPYIEQLVDAGRNIVESVGPAFQAVAPIFAFAFEALVTGIQAGSTGIRAFVIFVQDQMGNVYEFLGDSGLKFAGVLKKLGINIGTETLQTLKDYGAKQIAEADKNWQKLEADNDAYNARVLAQTVKHEGDKVTKVAAGGQARLRVQKEDGTASAAELKKQEKDFDAYVANVKRMWKLVEDSSVSYKDAIKELKPAIDKAMQTEAIEAQGKVLDASRKLADEYMQQMFRGKELPAIIKPTTDAIKGVGQNLSDSAGYALDLAGEIGGFDEKALDALDTVKNIADAMVRGLTGSGASAFLGWAGVVGGLLTVASMITGGDTERRRLMRENTAVMRDMLTDGIPLSTSASGATIAAAREALGGDRITALGALDRTGISRRGAQEGLVAELAKYGLRLSDLDKIASDLGMKIRRDDGSVVIDALKQLLEGLGASNLGTIRQSFGDQFDFFKDTQRLGGTSGTSQISGMLDFLRQIGGVSALEGLDATDPAVLRAELLKLFVQLNNGGVGSAAMGQLTGSGFKSVLEELIGLIDGLQPADTADEDSAGDALLPPGADLLRNPLVFGTTSGSSDLSLLFASIERESVRASSFLERSLPFHERTANATESSAETLLRMEKLLAQGGTQDVRDLDARFEARRRLANLGRGEMPTVR